MIKIGRKTALPGCSVEILSPTDGATLQRGQILVVTKASFLGLPPFPAFMPVNIRWKRVEDKSYAWFKNRTTSKRENIFSKIFRATVTINEPGEWNIIAMLEDVLGPNAIHEIEVTVV